MSHERKLFNGWDITHGDYEPGEDEFMAMMYTKKVKRLKWMSIITTAAAVSIFALVHFML